MASETTSLHPPTSPGQAETAIRPGNRLMIWTVVCGVCALLLALGAIHCFLRPDQQSRHIVCGVLLVIGAAMMTLVLCYHLALPSRTLTLSPTGFVMHGHSMHCVIPWPDFESIRIGRVFGQVHLIVTLSTCDRVVEQRSGSLPLRDRIGGLAVIALVFFGAMITLHPIRALQAFNTRSTIDLLRRQHATYGFHFALNRTVVDRPLDLMLALVESYRQGQGRTQTGEASASDAPT